MFIQEKPQNIPCILNGGGTIQVIGACPVTTDCIVVINYCENNKNSNNNSRCFSSSSAENAASKTLYAQCLMHIMLYTRTAGVVIDACYEVPGINILYYGVVGIVHTMVYEYT